MIKKFKKFKLIKESEFDPDLPMPRFVGRPKTMIKPKIEEPLVTGATLHLDIAPAASELIFSRFPEFRYAYNMRCDVSFINYTDKDDMISCFPANKIKGVTNPYISKYRQLMKVGKFFKKVFPNADDKKIEELVKKYKATYDMNVKDRFKNFKLVKGQDIRRWYKKSHYRRDIGGVNGSLGSSCMAISRNPFSNVWAYFLFKLYTSNPKKVNLLILTDENNKLMGRALVWHLDAPSGVTYMDRVYYTENKVEPMFRAYAAKHGWITRPPLRGKMIVHVKRDYGLSGTNPYMDTFRYFNPKEKYLTNVPWAETKFREYNTPAYI